MIAAVRRINSRTGPGSEAPPARSCAVSGFVVTHGLDDSPAAPVVGRQSLEVALQVTLDLAFGLGHEPQTGAISEHRREGADARTSRHTTEDSAGWAGPPTP